MDFETEAYHHTEFDLSEYGENICYRIDMTNKLQEHNRGLISSKGESYTVSATLLEVVHGKWKNNGDGEATLIIVSFRFIPPKNRRFRYAQIDWTFASDDPAIDIKVARVAPDAAWASDPIPLRLERTTGVTGTLGPSIAIANANLSTNYANTEAKELVYHTSVSGTSRMEGLKNKGGPHSARWVLKENPKHKQGICTMLQVAVLLRRPVEEGKIPKPRPEQTFKSTMEIAVNKGSLNAKGVLSDMKEEVQNWASRRTAGDQAVEYHPDKPSESGDFIVDKNNLHATSLEEMMYISLSSSWEDLKKERQEKKRAKEDAEMKIQNTEVKNKPELKEEKERNGEVDMKEQEHEKNKEGAGASTMPEVLAYSAGPNILPRSRGGGSMVPQGQTSPWLYVSLGILVMLVYQELMKSWSGSI